MLVLGKFIQIMKKQILILLFIISAFSVSAQSYDIGIHGGIFTPLDFWFYEDGKIGPSAGIKFNYHFNDKFTLSTNYFHGKFDHTPQTTLENTRVSFNLVSFVFARKFKLKNNWELHSGIGLGYYLEHAEGELNKYSGLKNYDRDLTFPIEMNINKEVMPNIIFGIKSGVFLSPFYWFGGFHLGPEISYRF